MSKRVRQAFEDSDDRFLRLVDLEDLELKGEKWEEVLVAVEALDTKPLVARMEQSELSCTNASEFCSE